MRWWALALLLFASPSDAEPAGPHLRQNEMFSNVARQLPGSYPRSWLGEPLYWTVVGTADGDFEALLSDEGSFEPRREGFSIEPFLFVEGTRITARDTVRRQSLEEGDLPIPSVVWEHPRVRLHVRAFAADAGTAFVSYRVENPGAEPARSELWLALRPMQVLPSWQFLNLQPGFSPIREIAYGDGRVWVNRTLALEARTPPDAFGAAAPDLGDALETGVLPEATAASDYHGLAAGALVWRFTLAPHATREVQVCVPLRDVLRGGRCSASRTLAATAASWRRQLTRAEIELPSAYDDVERTFRTALAHLLINRDGPRLQPGSRNYERSWIRDGALSSSALVQLGHADAARAFLAWYAPFQLDDGGMPCCVDRRGADPTPEYDSTGAFLYALGEYARHTRDKAFVHSLWPRVVRAVAHLEALRGERLGERFRSERGGATFGILPESISHEGYAKKAVHSYWDDLFARQGLRDAVLLAELVGDDAHAKAWLALRDAFSADLVASYHAAMKLHGIPHLPGSVELGDFDPTATAVGLELGGEPSDFPDVALRATFARYLGEVAERKRGVMARDAFAPYELRIAGALVRMGEREAAWDVLQLMLDGRRPKARASGSGSARGRVPRSEAKPSEAAQGAPAPRVPRSRVPRSEAKPSEAAGWNQWPEIVWTDETKGQWLGDLPHGWIAATYLHAVRTALVYERGSDQALVLAAGVPAEWLASGERVRVARLSTWWGSLDYELRREAAGSLRMRVGGGLRVPPGGVVLAPPGVAPVVVRALPADLVLRP